MDEKIFEEHLKKRYIPKAREDLADRIIRVAQETGPSFWRFLWAEIQGMFVLPAPVYALAASVVLGLLVGVEFSPEAEILDVDLLSFLSVEEEGWL